MLLQKELSNEFQNVRYAELKQNGLLRQLWDSGNSRYNENFKPLIEGPKQVSSKVSKDIIEKWSKVYPNGVGGITAVGFAITEWLPKEIATTKHPCTS